MTVTCLKTVVGGKQEHALCRNICLKKIFTLVAVTVYGANWTVTHFLVNLVIFSYWG